jgi:spermidine/putrescine-binding protein
MKRFFFLAMACLLSPAILFSGGQSSRRAQDTGGPVTITIATNRASTEVWNTDVWQDMQKRANVKVDYSFYDVDKMSLMMASSDLTDIVLTNQRFLSNVFAGNMAMKLDPILEKHIPNALLDIYKTRNQMLRLFLGGSDGGLYILSPGLGPENTGGMDSNYRGYAVRWDYYKEIGAPPIDNDDQFVEAVKAMVARHPTTPDGRKVWGIGLYNDLYYFFVHGILTSRLNPWVILNSQYMGDFATNEIHNGFTDTSRSAYWNDMRMLNKFYREGLFDPDSFTQTVDELTAKQNAGVYISTAFRTDGLYNEMRKTDPNTLAGFMLVPSAGTAVFANKPLVMGNAPDDSMFIYSKSKNWEAAARFLNIMQDPDTIRTVYSGFKGIHWDYDAKGEPYLFDKTIDGISGLTDEIKKLGIVDPPRQFIFCQPTSRHPDGHFYDLTREPSYRSKRLGLSPIFLDYADFYGVPYPSAAMLKNVENGRTIDMSHDFVQLISVGLTNIPLDIERIIQNLNAILYRALPRLITANSDTAYREVQQQVLAELRAAGEPTAWEWVRTNYNRYKTLTDPVIREYWAAKGQ